MDDQNVQLVLIKTAAEKVVAVLEECGFNVRQGNWALDVAKGLIDRTKIRVVGDGEESPGDGGPHVSRVGPP